MLMCSMKVPEDERKKNCCKIQLAGEYGLLVIAPDMIASLIVRIRRNDTREMRVPVRELFPTDYAGYLYSVMKANGQAGNIYAAAAAQLGMLRADGVPCFDRVKVAQRRQPCFDMAAGEEFFLLVRNAENRFFYVLPDEYGTGLCLFP